MKPPLSRLWNRCLYLRLNVNRKWVTWFLKINSLDFGLKFVTMFQTKNKVIFILACEFNKKGELHIWIHFYTTIVILSEHLFVAICSPWVTFRNYLDYKARHNLGCGIRTRNCSLRGQQGLRSNSADEQFWSTSHLHCPPVVSERQTRKSGGVVSRFLYVVRVG